MSILLLTKRTVWCRTVQALLRGRAPDSLIIEGERSDPLPDAVSSWSGDYLLSFVAPWIVPPAALGRARKSAINFHPGPPEYPGIGCYNFALYDNVSEYGVTCHEMTPAVDTGPILKVVRFPVTAADTVETLKARSMEHMVRLFGQIVAALLTGEHVGRSADRWMRRPFRRRDLDDLCRIDPAMSEEEVQRRIRATRFPGAPGPFLELGGHRFVLE